MKNSRFHVIQIKERFFCGLTKTGRLSTAWHIAGAKMYLHKAEAEDDLLALTGKLKSKFKYARIISLNTYESTEDRAINIEACVKGGAF
ncbi:hypothetical protein [Vibrio fluvialis]|uniref:hypothetical protein n=1 Tax=Vibrio fluvialis TaxID=676 RepID=UPI0024DF9E08|nr:hypothetical protein [Vibrio fluvialis]WIE05928.1 hypothetical protein QN061_18105 [Vibrio fluvialis]